MTAITAWRPRRLSPALRATFSTSPAKLAGLVVLAVFVLVAFGGLIAPQDPLAQGMPILAHPSGHHLLGTDYLGRDTLSRLVAGARPTVLSALAIVALGLVGGVLPGVASAFLGRAGEFLLVRVSDAALTLPYVVFAIALAGLFTNGALAAVVAVGVLFAPRFFRIVRAETLVYARAQYVEAAELMGASPAWIVRTHILRKVAPTIAVTCATSVATAILAISGLSFLGLGVQPPTPTWGGMLSADVQYLSLDGLGAIWPGITIVIVVLALNTLADELRDALHLPRERHPTVRIPDEPMGVGHGRANQYQ